MCDCADCTSTATAPTLRLLRAEALLGSHCTCDGPAGPDYCDLHSSKMLLDRLSEQARERSDEATDREEALDKAQAQKERAKTLVSTVREALVDFRTAVGLPAPPASPPAGASGKSEESIALPGKRKHKATREEIDEALTDLQTTVDAALEGFEEEID